MTRLALDSNDRIVLPEAKLEGIAFIWTKIRYHGQAEVERMDMYGSVKQRLVGLMVEGTEENGPEVGAKIFQVHDR